MPESTAISQLTLDGIPTPFESCTLELDGDSWVVTVVGMYEAYGVPNKRDQIVPVSFDTPGGRRAGMATVASVEPEEHHRCAMFRIRFVEFAASR